MSDVKLSPTRLAALRLVAEGQAEPWGDAERPWWRNPERKSQDGLDSTPFRWLAKNDLISVGWAPAGSFRTVLSAGLTHTGHAALAANPNPKES